MPLDDALNMATPPPAPPADMRPPTDAWRPHSDIGDDGGTIVTVPYEAGTGESDTEQILADHGLTPAQWKVTSYRRSTWQGFDGRWLEATKLSIAPIRPGRRFGVDMPDLDDLDRLLARTPDVEAPEPDEARKISVCAPAGTVTRRIRQGAGVGLKTSVEMAAAPGRTAAGVPSR